MKIALDANRYSDLMKDDPAVTHLVHRAEKVVLPFCVVAEMRAGFLAGDRPSQNESRLRSFLEMPGVSVLLPDEETTVVYATLYQQLRKQGTPIPINDVWIAACVVQHHLLLCTRDRHFDHLPQVQRI